MSDDRRLIEDYLPIQAISAEASREKSVRKGHISTLHLWWARRPLVACRAAVYGALVPASRFRPLNGPEEKRDSLTRANAAKFVERLCKYPGDPNVIAEAERHILEAHAERLTRETGATVAVDDIVAGRAPRPKVLDMFAGGGSIPLEALRLGCEAYAVELNPVAHIIELCTLVYPQKYGKPDRTAKGSAKDGTWAGLAAEVRHWGQWVLDKVRAEIGDLYPPIPDPAAPKIERAFGDSQYRMAGSGFHSTGQQRFATETPAGYLTPVAYLWTRTVRCKNPACGATVPLVRQTWLCKKKGRYAALKMVTPVGEKRVRFQVVEAATESALGFDPAAFSKGGNATCPFCGTVADINYVKSAGSAGQIDQRMMAIVCAQRGKTGKAYVSADDLTDFDAADESIGRRIESLCSRTGFTAPSEPMPPRGTLGFRVQAYGLTTWGHLFTPRQMLCLLEFAATTRAAESQMQLAGYSDAHVSALTTYLSFVLDRLADWNSSLCSWSPESTGGAKIGHTFGRQALPMVWDFAESAVWGEATGSAELCLDWVLKGLAECLVSERAAIVGRGSSMAISLPDGSCDAVVTDPPYYDNVPYADISDFFYVWLKRTVGHLYPEHFASGLTPKKGEAIADPSLHAGDIERAKQAYETMMAQAFGEAHRVLKPNAEIVVVYAHKTTLGWATLLDALRKAKFTVTEAWPFDTEMKSRLRGMQSAALASSIFLVGRKREGADTGSYEDEVRPELEQIVRERVATLWEMGIAGADLIIAAVGAGLRAFTRFARVEYANGEEVPAERFLAEVEGVVLETLLEKIFGVPRAGVATVDGPSRFYVLWRYTYKAAEMDAGEAIVFTYGQPVELDGADGLSSGPRPLVQKKKGKYRLLDFTERGADEKRGMPGTQAGTPAPPGGSPAPPQEPVPLIDVLHRILWLIENEPRSLNAFLDKAQPDRERLRLIAQTLARAGLSGRSTQESGALVTTTAAEQTALGKLLANWRALIDTRLTLMDTGLFGGAQAKETTA